MCPGCNLQIIVNPDLAVDISNVSANGRFGDAQVIADLFYLPSSCNQNHYNVFLTGKRSEFRYRNAADNIGPCTFVKHRAA